MSKKCIVCVAVPKKHYVQNVSTRTCLSYGKQIYCKITHLFSMNGRSMFPSNALTSSDNAFNLEDLINLEKKNQFKNTREYTDQQISALW